VLKNRERVVAHNKKVMEVKFIRSNSTGNQKLVQLEEKFTKAEERRQGFL